ncbi:hypothetical protein [Lacipirellula sp.]|uniref:hypothetical protein n=1 Tax=Lacipirellula sp. TaxID=2691419 RepID=UPI003D146A2B
MPQPPEDDDDFELELEPVDPEIIAHRQERVQQTVESAAKKIDVDELYEPRSDYSDLELDLSGLKSFRFTTRTLLLITAVVAVGMTIRLMYDGCMVIFIAMVATVAFGWYWISILERKQEAERLARREAFQARMAAPHASPAAQPAATAKVPESKPASPFDDGAPLDGPEKRPFFDVDFAYSMQELLITSAAVAVAFGLLTWITKGHSPKVFGLIALAGLASLAANFKPHRLVVLAWGALMVIYVGYGFVTMMMPVKP